ncbi:MAG: glyoxylase-like metal-dependent hydrolase (beta-lactamase superfamily II) [Sphingobacteriales bacterium]|jgi:glyoxylase-like metal-dependent hydrolase (beta-lactamase superfamily II)
MKLHVINSGHFKLDGGAMFGVVPKSIWNNLNPADQNNMCSWATRCLLIEDGDRLILIDTGMGNKQSDKFFGYYFLHGNDSLEKSLATKGFHPDDITDVFLTHLHFDHVGGSIKWNNEKSGYRPAFKNAKYWSNSDHWQSALNPNPREKASFLKENILPIQESGQLNFYDKSSSDLPQISAITVNGHTEAQMLPVINYKDREIIFCADLFPSSHHLPLAWVIAYDVQPLLTMKERQMVLERGFENNSILFFEHDPIIESATIIQTEKGYRVGDKGDLSSIL